MSFPIISPSESKIFSQHLAEMLLLNYFPLAFILQEPPFEHHSVFWTTLTEDIAQCIHIRDSAGSGQESDSTVSPKVAVYLIPQDLSFLT